MGFYVPETLRSLDNWVVWRLEDNNKGKPLKVPYSPATGLRASTTDRSTWGSYAEAVLRLDYDAYNGLGFVFSADSGLVFIDLDNCFTPEGEETALAKEIQALFPGSYAEISQSENGLHIVCKGILPQAIKRPEIEVYSWGRYMAFTGNATSLTEPQEAQESINTLIQKYGRTEPPQAPLKPYKSNIALSEEELLAVILKSRQGAKFKKLLSGDTTGYSSHSEADQAFINIANYFCNGDEEMILALWRRSRLSERRKGQREDYLSRTIKKAQRDATGSRTAGKIDRSRLSDQPTAKRKRRF